MRHRARLGICTASLLAAVIAGCQKKEVRTEELFQAQALGELLRDLDADPLLLHRIAIAQRDCIAQRRIFFAQRFEINSHTERRTDFVLTAVSPADRAARSRFADPRHLEEFVRELKAV